MFVSFNSKVLKAAFGEFASITKSGFSEEEISRAK